MKRQYQLLIGAAIIALILGGIVYQSFETTVFFYTPKEILDNPAQFQGKTVRIGAMVEKESTQWDAEKVLLRFRVTEDNEHFIPVVYAGVKPDLFREGQGVVVEGQLDKQGNFVAANLLVKHSEEYSVDQAERMQKEAAYRSLIQN